jgi:hypothetical protein
LGEEAAALKLERSKLASFIEARRTAVLNAEQALETERRRASDLEGQARELKVLIARMEEEAEEANARRTAANARKSDKEHREPLTTPEAKSGTSANLVPEAGINGNRAGQREAHPQQNSASQTEIGVSDSPNLSEVKRKAVEEQREVEAKPEATHTSSNVARNGAIALSQKDRLSPDALTSMSKERGSRDQEPEETFPAQIYAPTFKFLNNTDLEGELLQLLTGASHDECVRACREILECQAFTYKTTSKQCSLRKKIVRSNMARGSDSGVKTK